MAKSRIPGIDLPWWSLLAPVLACGLLPAVQGDFLPDWQLVAVSAALVVSVLVAVFHAEVVAHRVGEPLGTLVLALCVTVIEVSLIVSLMFSGGPATSALARDTVFATVMIICNGVIGISVMIGALHHRIVSFSRDSISSALSVLAALTTLTLVLPKFTTTTTGPTYSFSQLVFAGGSSLLLYGVFIFVQTVRHREFFLHVEAGEPEEHAPPPGVGTALASLCLLIFSLIAVVGLAKKLAPSIERGVAAVGAPEAVVGVAIAALVLLPETLAALRAARLNRIQTSLNLALGSALATIGLTIPAVAAASVLFDIPLELGLSSLDTVLLFLTLLMSTITLAIGRATVLQGAVHLVVFAAFLFLSVVP